jgi:hypothetical protein
VRDHDPLLLAAGQLADPGSELRAGRMKNTGGKFSVSSSAKRNPTAKGEAADVGF